MPDSVCEQADPGSCAANLTSYQRRVSRGQETHPWFNCASAVFLPPSLARCRPVPRWVPSLLQLG